MVRRVIGLGVALVAAAALSGCGSFLDDLNAAAEWQAQQEAYRPAQPVPDTDYAAACHTYGCGNGASGATVSPVPQSGCPYGGSGSGTACPQ